MVRLIRQPTSTLVASAPIGSSTFEETKSITSKNVLPSNAGSSPSGCQPDQRLNDSTDPVPSAHVAPAVIATARERESPRCCCSQATSGSSAAIDGVSAANTSSRKNSVP